MLLCLYSPWVRATETKTLLSYGVDGYYQQAEELLGMTLRVHWPAFWMKGSKVLNIVMQNGCLKKMIDADILNNIILVYMGDSKKVVGAFRSVNQVVPMNHQT